MAAVAGDLSKQILGQSDAAKTFRPWWDNLEDGILYSLVVMGMITLPMTFLTGTPLDCTIHPSLWFNNFTDYPFGPEEVPKYSRYMRTYSKKYCTEMHVSPFLLYFPFTLFLIPLVIVFIEKCFIAAYNADTKLETFYDCLIKASLEREDVAMLEEENIKNTYEIQQAFRNSSACYYSYLYRTILELICSMGLAIFYFSFSQIDGIRTALFDCSVHSVPFRCVIPNSRFFWMTYFLAMTMISFYIACTMYNLLWIVHPKVGKLDRFLTGCNRQKSRHVDRLACDVGKKDVPVVHLDMYFDPKGRDFRLLMNLLSETSGMAQSFRILAVFDKHFQRQWRARDIKLILEEPRGAIFQKEREQRLDIKSTLSKSLHQTLLIKDESESDSDNETRERHKSLWVFWNDATIAHYVNRVTNRNIFEYTLDITPCTEAPVKSFQYHTVPDFTASAHHREIMIGNGVDTGVASGAAYKYSTRFDGLLEDTDYTIAISTELDGKTITQVTLAAVKTKNGAKINTDKLKEKMAKSGSGKENGKNKNKKK